MSFWYQWLKNNWSVVTRLPSLFQTFSLIKKTYIPYSKVYTQRKTDPKINKTINNNKLKYD